MICPNKFPTQASNRKIALIGEAPGADEERACEPFVGYSGRFLAALLSRSGVSRESCFLGNVSQHRPPDNDFSSFTWNGLQVQHGISKLSEDISKFSPNIIVLLGNVPLKAAKDCFNSTPQQKFKNAQWRGSLFLGGPGPFEGRKCISTYHPAFCLRDYECTPFLMLDLRKAVREASDPALRFEERINETASSVDQVESKLRAFQTQRSPLACDLEGYHSAMSCITFAPSKNYSFTVPLRHKSGAMFWQPADAVRVWRAITAILEDPAVPKTFQFGMYDSFVLHYGHGIRVRNYLNDTIHKHWEMYSELAKSDDKGKATSKRGMGLAIQASIYTDRPYYKEDRKSDDDKVHYDYCGMDGMVTKEIDDTLESIFHGPGGNGFTPVDLRRMREHYAFNCSLLPAFRYMMMRGIRYDSQRASERRNFLRVRMFEAQARLNGITGHGFSFKSKDEITQRAREIMLVKKGDRPYAGKEADAERFQALMRLPNPSLATIGELEDLCEVSLNVDSPKQFVPFLYETLGLPTQFNDDKEHPRPTADYEALLKLARICKQTENTLALSVVHLAIELRALSNRQSDLEERPNADGRMRSSYNITGTNTGRVSCSESPAAV